MPERNRKPSLRGRILIAMLVAGMVPLIAVTMQSLHCAHEGIVDLQERQLGILLEQQRARVLQWVNERGDTLRVIGNCPTIYTLLETRTAAAEAAMKTHLDGVVATNPFVQSITVYGGDWQPAVTSPTTMAQPHGADAAWQRQLMAANGIVWKAEPSDDSGSSIGIQMGYPVTSGDKRLGYLLAHLHMTLAVPPLVSSSTEPTSTKVYLVNRQDQRYVSQAPGVGTGTNTRAAHLPETLLSTNSTQHSSLVTYNNAEGVEVFGKAMALDELDALLVAEVDQAEALSLLSFLLRRASFMAVAVIVIATILAIVFTRRLGRPLDELRRVCGSIAGGAVQQRVGTFAEHETSEVAAAFNSMLDDLANAQRELVQASALAAVGELSASVVHEMRNPLSTIKMNLHTVAGKVEDDPTYAELATLAIEQTARLEQMLNDLLQYGRPVELKRGPIQPEAIITEVKNEMANQHAAKALTWHVATDGVKRLNADPEQFRRVMVNLMENASQACGDGGHVSVRCAAQGNQVILHVTDSGPGITADNLERVFQPFYTTREQGTGLGLATVKKIVELHGGSIAVSNPDDGGAKFTVTLPCGETAKEAVAV